MGSPAFWGKIATFTGSLRKPALKPFGLFNASDNLDFLADIPGFGETFSQASQAFASILAIDTSAGNVITIILTGDVTSSSLDFAGGAVPDGQWNYIRFVQDAVGGWTVSLPANLAVDLGFSVDPGPGRATVLPIRYDASGGVWTFFGQAFSSPSA